ncbi:class I SAM-dependent methyltransferase [Pelotomaculum propionicicum]|uniref:class I SAM-dependent methyltransferase n=1 Tax=Pelotomaculum propionicicum TaxID=258475 RepID=UPI003B81A2D4
MDTGSAVPLWQYDERAKAGVDYKDASVAAEYDKQHGKFRDFEKDARAVMQLLDLKPDHTVIDLGCGTGAFVIPAARSCRKVYAVDISPAMLDRCQEKARAEGLDNIETHCAGFLSYKHNGDPVDAVVSVAALHHLPDFWKAVAFKRMYDMLKPGGKLYLFDIIFTFPVESYRSEFDSWVNGMRERAGQSMADESIVHIRDEYSTFDWVIDGMVERVGFKTEQKFSNFPRSLTYICTRPEGR